MFKIRPGTWIIDGWVVPYPVKAEYAKTSIKLTCLALGGDDDPRVEIQEAESKIVLGYDNSFVLNKGTVLYTLNDINPYLIVDGIKSFYGIVTNVEWDEGSASNKYILYTINIAKWRETEDTFGVYALEDGDETRYDDDWEYGWETYTPPCQEDKTGTGTSAQTQTVCPDKYNWKNKYVYVAGNTYPNLTRYSREPIYGASKSIYGWLDVPLYRHTFMSQLKKYTYVLVAPGYVNSAYICYRYGGYIGTLKTGRYGEVIIGRPSKIPDKRIEVAGQLHSVPYNANGIQKALFRFTSRRTIVFRTAIDHANDLEVLQITVGNL